LTNEFGNFILELGLLSLELIWIFFNKCKDGIKCPKMGLSGGLMKKLDELRCDIL
jgi:hypothetical protein